MYLQVEGVQAGQSLQCSSKEQVGSLGILKVVVWCTDMLLTLHCDVQLPACRWKVYKKAKAAAAKAAAKGKKGAKGGKAGASAPSSAKKKK